MSVDVAKPVHGGGRKVVAGVNDLDTTHHDVALEWHPDRNGTLTPRGVSAGSHLSIWWTCGKHDWQAAVFNRTSRISPTGCPKCNSPLGRPRAARGTIAEERPDLAAEWHPSRNGDLTPAQVTCGSKKQVWWLLPCGHAAKATPAHRGSRRLTCPECDEKSRSSRPEASGRRTR